MCTFDTVKTLPTTVNRSKRKPSQSVDTKVHNNSRFIGIKTRVQGRGSKLGGADGRGLARALARLLSKPLAARDAAPL